MGRIGLLTTALVWGFASSAAEANDEKPRLAVLDIATTEAVGPDAPRAIGAMIGVQLDETGVFDVITQDDVRKMIGFDRMRTVLDCELESSCLAEIGAALGVRWLVVGNLASVDDELVLSLTLIDIEEAAAAGREIIRGDVGSLLVQLPETVRKLTRSIVEGQVGTLAILEAPDGAIVEIDGRALGTTPLPPVTLAAGSHRVSIKREGYFAFEEDIELAAGEDLDLVVELRRAEIGDDPRFFLFGGAAMLAGGVVLAGLGYGASALFGFAYSRIPFYADRSGWLYVPGAGAAIFAALYTSTDGPTGANDRGTGRVLSLASLGAQALGAAIAVGGAGLLTYGLIE